MTADRRTFLQLLGTGALGAAVPPGIARALEIPANRRTGTIADVEHVVILMQENRSFDHYFGTLRGVRGFGDPRVARLPSGKSVWNQPNGSDSVLPFHPRVENPGLQFIVDLDHGWTTTHAAWNGGKYDQWVPTKGTTSMAYFTRADIPYQYALADAFTICDAYYCSLLGSTDPNRYHMWTGWVGNDGRGGGPVIDNAEAGYDWSTYPERLQAAGVSWKIYQDIGVGLDAPGLWGWTSDAYIGNFGDNSLLYFHQYQNALPGSPLYQNARTGTNIAAGGTLFDVFRADVQSGKLPQVSWIVAPEAYSEHPNWPANYGAWYVSQMLDALTANPEVWSKTALFLTYDENDGFFDHMVPPTPPRSRAEGVSTIPTTNEIFPGSSKYATGPYGLGVRVPLIVISPWSKGGWVNSQVFDHTSLIRFIERRFGPDYPGLIESNITPWRRAVCGDLTSAFNFTRPNAARVPLPSTAAYVPPDNNRHPDYIPAVPADQALPAQEPGLRPARALPYELHTHAEVDAGAGTVQLHFANSGKVAAVFQVRSGDGLSGPWTYTVGAGARISDTFSLATLGQSTYDLSVHGPNGFFRQFRGSLVSQPFAVNSRLIHDRDDGSVLLEIENFGKSAATVHVLDGYSGKVTSITLRAGQKVPRSWRLQHSFGWYDLNVTSPSDPTFVQHFAGHVESDEDSMSDPAIGSR
jgi:phospholipase C